jgi:hypothetical protein
MRADRDRSAAACVHIVRSRTSARSAHCARLHRPCQSTIASRWGENGGEPSGMGSAGLPKPELRPLKEYKDAGY